MAYNYVPGNRLSGRALRQLQPTYVALTSDVTTNFNDVLTDVPIMVLPVRARARYTLDGYLAYSSNSTADIKFALLGPNGTQFVHWGLFGVTQGGGGFGALEGHRRDVLGEAAGAAGSAAPMVAHPHGYFRVGDVEGAIRVQFAQITANASPTTIRAGSWLRIVQVV